MKYLVVYDFDNSVEIECENLSNLYFKLFEYCGGYYGLTDKQLKMLCDDFTMEQFIKNFDIKYYTIILFMKLSKQFIKKESNNG